MTALSRFAALKQRREDAGVGIHAGRNVGDRTTGLGRFVGRAGHRQETRLALDQQVVGFFVAVRAVVAIARDVADDELRMRGAQGVGAQAHARGGAGREVLHQHIGLGHEGFERRQRRGLFEVEREAFLGAVDPGEMRRHAVHARVVGAREIARTGALDLDDARAEVGELARAKRRGDRMFERDDGDAVERSDHGVLASERPRQPEHMLGHVGIDEVGRDRRNLVQPGLAEFALDVVFTREAETAMGLQADIGCFP